MATTVPWMPSHPSIHAFTTQLRHIAQQNNGVCLCAPVNVNDIERTSERHRLHSRNTDNFPFPIELAHALHHNIASCHTISMPPPRTASAVSAVCRVSPSQHVNTPHTFNHILNNVEKNIESPTYFQCDSIRIALFARSLEIKHQQSTFYSLTIFRLHRLKAHQMKQFISILFLDAAAAAANAVTSIFSQVFHLLFVSYSSRFHFHSRHSSFGLGKNIFSVFSV